MSEFIPVNEPLLNGNEKKYLLECIDSGWISSEGPFVKKFEEEFAKRVKRVHGIAVSSGTGALDIAIDALGIGPDDEVIVPTFTIISCVNQLLRCGAKPVLVDCEEDTWNMNIADIERKITKRTKAIMIVHIYGLPVDIDPVLELARNYGLKVIEDAAEMHGQEYKQKPCGSFGDISIFSFYPNKHITTGEGGMIVTNSERLAEQCSSLRNLCFETDRRFVHERLGWNYRMTNIQAAIGLAQLERLDEFVRIKRKMGERYNQIFNSSNYFQLPITKTDYAENIYWVYGLVLDRTLGIEATQARDYLSKNGVGSRSFFYPIHKQPVLKKMGISIEGEFPVSERLYKYGFYIPSGLALTTSQIDRVGEVVNDLVKLSRV